MDKINIKEMEVEKQLDYEDIVVKLYKVPVKHRCNRNIVGENQQGEVVWQIDDVLPNQDSPFVNINPYSNEKIKASNWIGVDYYVYISDGRIELLPNQRPW
ncbi:hypothetical protein [Eubacterium ventriosum]|uniref:hypothetical protein n=1 Tax=Eubacterium ventriosum TaxID=39496 RepID=UPI003AB24185